MPVLEKMDFPVNTPHRASKTIPSPLKVLRNNAPEALEPPLISPAYPEPLTEGDGSLTGELFLKCGDAIQKQDKVEKTVLEREGDVSAIQAPDVTSTCDVTEENKTEISTTASELKEEDEPVNSNQTTGTASRSQKLGNYKKVRKKPKKPNLKHRSEYLKQSAQVRRAMLKAKKVRGDCEITELYIIGPESVVRCEDGEDRYMCQMCGKQCKYPVGLKIHLRTYHHYLNVQIRGIAKKPWARGIALKRDREKQEEGDAMSKPQSETWQSVDCSLVQSALEKMKDGRVHEAGLCGPKILNDEEKLTDDSLSTSQQGYKAANPESLQVSLEKVEDCEVLSELPSSFEAANDVVEGSGEDEKANLENPEPKEEVGTVDRQDELEMKSATCVEMIKKEITESYIETDKAQVKSENTAEKPLDKKSSSPRKGKNSSNIFPKKFSCDLCHQAFAYKVWRDKHLRMHTESQSGHGCDYCNVRFFSKKDLVLHERSNHGKLETVKSKVKLEVDEGVDEVVVNRTSKHGPSNKASGKAKGNKTLAKLVETLQAKSAAAAAENSEKGTKPAAKKRRQASTITKGYLCRLCGSAFSNPSNRSRHMRVIHGLTSKKKAAVKNESKQSKDIDRKDKHYKVKSEELSPNSFSPTKLKSQSPTKLKVPFSPVSATKKTTLSPDISPKKEKSPTPTKKKLHLTKKGTPEKRKVPEQYGFWRKVPRVKVRENKEFAHQQNISRKTSILSFDPRDFQEFPKSPHIFCPWEKVEKPVPFVPKQRKCHIDVLHSMQSGVSDKPCNDYGKFQTKVEDFVMDGHAIDLSKNLVKSTKPRIKYTQSCDLSGSLIASRGGLKEEREIKDQTENKAGAIDENLLKRMETPLKQAKQVRPRVKITSKISSKKSSKHTISVNPVEWLFSCNICMCNFMSIRELSQHVVAHAEDYPYKCEFCMHVFIFIEELRDHKESKHSVKKMYVCSVCKQEFAYLSNLQNHQSEAHKGVECSFDDKFCNDVRPQNFTDPTKAFNLRAYPSQTSERVSYIKEEMSKLTPLKHRMTSQEKEKVAMPKKPTPEKGMLFNPQRHHPFEQRRKIGFLSMLSDPRNQKQLGAKVSNVCTKCLLEFKDTSSFHVHIMECANIKDDVTNKVLSDSCQNSKDDKTEDSIQMRETVETEKKTDARTKAVKHAATTGRRGRDRTRAKPGSIIYDPQKYIRVKSVSAFDDIHACAGCGKKFYFINKLERHMKMCPNREKIVNAHKSNLALALRKRPRVNTMQHKCTNCDKHFTYLGSLEKHLLMCTRYDYVAPAPVALSSETLETDYATMKSSLPPEKDLSAKPTEGSLPEDGSRRRCRNRVAPYWRLPQNSL